MNPESGNRRPSTVIAIAAIAVVALVFSLVFSMGGFAGAAGKKGLLTVATGSVDLVANGDGAVIDLADAEFIQEPGMTVLLVAELKADLPDFQDFDGDGNPDGCGAAVFFQATTDDPAEGVGQALDIVNGGLSSPRAIEGLTPPATSLSYTVGVSPEGGVTAFCDVEFAEGEAPTIPVELEVAVLAVG